MAEQLLWTREVDSEKKSDGLNDKAYIAPSWSWASVNGRHQHFLRLGFKFNPTFKFVDSSVQPDPGGDTYGALLSASISVEARVRLVSWELNQKCLMFDLDGQMGKYGTTYPDRYKHFPANSPDGRTIDVWFLELADCTPSVDVESKIYKSIRGVYGGLLLLAKNERLSIFARVGVAFVGPRTRRGVPSREPQHKWRNKPEDILEFKKAWKKEVDFRIATLI